MTHQCFFEGKINFHFHKNIAHELLMQMAYYKKSCTN